MSWCFLGPFLRYEPSSKGDQTHLKVAIDAPQQDVLNMVSERDPAPEISALSKQTGRTSLCRLVTLLRSSTKSMTDTVRRYS